MSVQRAKFEIPSSEFVDWVIFLDGEVHRFHREDVQFAALTAEIRRSWVKDPQNIKDKDFMVEFKKKVEVSRLSVEERTRMSKAVWGVIVDNPQPLKKGK